MNSKLLRWNMSKLSNRIDSLTGVSCRSIGLNKSSDIDWEINDHDDDNEDRRWDVIKSGAN